MGTQENIERMSRTLSEEVQEASREFARSTIQANPKLVARYFSGKSALSDLVAWASQASNGTIDEHLTGEYCVLFMEEAREMMRDG